MATSESLGLSADPEAGDPAWLRNVYNPLWFSGLRLVERFHGEGTREHVRRHLTELLAFPEDLQIELGRAIYRPFTLSSPAPAFEASAPHINTFLCTVELDTLTAGNALLKAGLRPAVLNMANERNCGGAWTHMRGSQEEALFHSSSLPLSLWPHRRTSDNRAPTLPLARGQPFYPLTDAGTIYTSRALVTHTLRRECVSSADRFEVAVISAAAQDLRWWTPGTTQLDDALLRQKIRSILYTGAAERHDALVLGALGTGAFKHDPDIVAGIFSDILSAEFAGQFRVVVFAIIFSDENLQAFARQFDVIEAPSDNERIEALTRAAASRHGFS